MCELNQLRQGKLPLTVLVLGVSVLADVQILCDGLLVDVAVFTKFFEPHAIFTSKRVYKSQIEILKYIS